MDSSSITTVYTYWTTGEIPHTFLQMAKIMLDMTNLGPSDFSGNPNTLTEFP